MSGKQDCGHQIFAIGIGLQIMEDMMPARKALENASDALVLRAPAGRMSQRLWIIFLGSLLAIAVAPLGVPGNHAHAQSNGYSEDGNWRFQTTADLANKGSVQQLIEIKKANGFVSMNSYDIRYNIDGDYINCSVSSNVTGNQGAIDQNAPVGSPTLTSSPAFTASSTGNSNDTAVDSTGSQSGISSSNQIPVGILDGTVSDGSAMLSGSNQELSDSQLSASVSGSRAGFNVGSATGHGGGGSVVLNSAQSNEGSVLSAGVSDSQACAFSRVTGNGVANAGR